MNWTQRGTALIVSLLILLVLTLIGVTAMTSSTMQEKMAGNSREYNLGFQAAESALRDGEADLSKNNPAGYDATCNPGQAGHGLCLPATNGTALWSSIDWNGTIPRLYGSQTAATALVGIPANQQKYIIEKLPQQPLSGDNLAQPGCYNCTLTIQNYRVTAIGTGANGTASIMVQSIYRP